MTVGTEVSVSRLEITVDSMHPGDMPAILAIERASFSSPWPARAYSYELRNEASHYFVLRGRAGESRRLGRLEMEGSRNDTPRDVIGAEMGVRRLFQRMWQGLRQVPQGPVVGYGGFWTARHRAHISTLAVAPKWRGRKLGLLLMLHMLDRARFLGMTTVTLEARVSNHVAQNLYGKCGFRRSGVQRSYYRDNGEDALLMTSSSLTDPSYGLHLRSLWREVQRSVDVGCVQAS